MTNFVSSLLLEIQGLSTSAGNIATMSAPADVTHEIEAYGQFATRDSLGAHLSGKSDSPDCEG